MAKQKKRKKRGALRLSKEALGKMGAGEVKTVTLTFTNNDVPEFLEKLRRFERASRRAHIVVK